MCNILQLCYSKAAMALSKTRFLETASRECNAAAQRYAMRDASFVYLMALVQPADRGAFENCLKFDNLQAEALRVSKRVLAVFGR